MVFFRTKLGKILNWQKSSETSESDFKSAGVAFCLPIYNPSIPDFKLAK